MRGVQVSWLVLAGAVRAARLPYFDSEPRSINVKLQLPVSPDNTCGHNAGYTCEADGVVAGTGSCCSAHGYCGNTTVYCGVGCQPKYGYCGLDPFQPSSVVVSPPLTTSVPLPSTTFVSSTAALSTSSSAEVITSSSATSARATPSATSTSTRATKASAQAAASSTAAVSTNAGKSGPSFGAGIGVGLGIGLGLALLLALSLWLFLWRKRSRSSRHNEETPLKLRRSSSHSLVPLSGSVTNTSVSQIDTSRVLHQVSPTELQAMSGPQELYGSEKIVHGFNGR